MAIDRTTETIAHFLGLFALRVEQERLRDAYDDFTAERRAAELTPVEPVAPEVDTSHALVRDGDAPKMPAVPEGREETRLDVPRWQPPGASGDGAAGPGPAPPAGSAAAEGAGPAVRLPPAPAAEAAGPGSMLTVTGQVARLFDADRVGTGEFRDPAAHAADLASWAASAAALHAPSGPDAATGPGLADALALHAAMQGFVAAVPAGAEVFTALGPATPQRIVNGEAVPEVPSWQDLLPGRHRDGTDAGAVEDRALPDLYRPDPEAPKGHGIVAGGNLLVNEAQVALSHVDAPLIAVGGTWVQLDIVSQVALVSNRDDGAGADIGPTSVYQIVEVESAARSAAWTLPGADPGAAPGRISVEIVHGDLFVSNHIDQIVEIRDDDAFGLSILSANSAWILGANVVVNAASLVTAGFGYDLILVGGDFVSVDTIHQSLVLLDDDRVDTGASVAAPAVWGAGRATEGSAQAAEGIAGGVGAPTGRGDPIPQEPATDPAPDNLLVNKALLKTVGLDTAADLSASLAGLVAAPPDDLEALREELLTDPALAGLEQARVLKIDGDLILSNTILQTILASDRDDILVEGAPPGLGITAGQNALMNAAAISVWGVDSTVMAGGGAYSDLLIHQARLVDEPEAPDPGLVPEAVAFLMDDIGAAVAGKTADLAGKADPAPADAYDLMQTSLT